MGFTAWNDDVSYIRLVVPWLNMCLTYISCAWVFEYQLPNSLRATLASVRKRITYDQFYKTQSTLFVSTCKVCRHLHVSAFCGSVVKVAWRWLVRCVCPTHSRSGWIRRKRWQENNSGRLSASGTVHFSPEAEGGPLVTLMDRNVAHPHTHTRPHMSHTLSLSHNNLHVIAFTWSHTRTQTRRWVHAVTHRLLCPTRFDIQWENVYALPTRHFLPCQ